MKNHRLPLSRLAFVVSLVLAGTVWTYDDPNQGYRPYSCCWLVYEPDIHTLGLFHLDGADDADSELDGALDLEALDAPAETGLVTASSGKEAPALPAGVTGESLADAAESPVAAQALPPFSRLAEGQFAGALALEGKGSAILAPIYKEIPAGGQFAVEAWLRPAHLGGTLFWLPGALPLSLRLAEDGALIARYGRDEVRSPAGALRTGAWQHVALTITPSAEDLRSAYGTREYVRDGLGARSTGRFVREPAVHGPELRVLINGTVVARHEDRELPTWVRRLSGAVLVGNVGAGDEAYVGAVDELRISGRARMYYPHRLDRMAGTAGTGFPRGQPALRDAGDEVLHLPLDGTLPQAASGNAADPDSAQPRFAAGVHGQSAMAGPGVRSPAIAFPAGLSARSGTLDLWFSPADWDNGKSLYQKETIREKPPVEMTPLLQLSSCKPDGSEAQPLLTVSAHLMWPEIGTPAPILKPGRWYHLTVTFDHGRAQAYLDGQVLEERGLVVSAQAPPADHRLDRLRFAGDFPWRPKKVVRRPGRTLIDEVRYYNRPLTPIEVANGHARFLPAGKLAPLPFAHIAATFEPVAERVFVDAVLLSPEWREVTGATFALHQGGRTALAEGELAPFHNGRAWQQLEGVSAAAPEATIKLRYNKEGGGAESQEAVVEVPERPFATDNEPTPYTLAYYPYPNRIRIAARPIWQKGPVRSDFLRTPDGRPGLAGRYFDNRACNGEPILTRTDPAVAFTWRKTPGPNLPADCFGILWEGALGPAPYTGTYEVSIDAKGGARLTLGGEVRVDSFEKAKAPTAFTLNLEKGGSLPLQLRYRHGRGDGGCHLLWRYLPEAGTVLNKTVSLRVTDAEDKPVCESKGKLNPASEALLPVENVPDGKYKVYVRMPTGEKEYVRWFERIHFEWEHNDLGVTTKVLPPFTPLEVEARNLSVVMRRYRVGGLGLWESIQARGNDTPMRELLSRPIRLLANGVPLAGTGRFTAVAGHEAVYEGAAAHPAVQVSTRCRTEYDGCLKVALTLEPPAAAEVLKSLTLEIPLKDEMAPLWHMLKIGIRGNPAGFTPPGSGEVWNSKKHRVGAWPGNFKHYLWFGAEERGLCWFADNEKGWLMDWEKEPPCQTLHREDGELLLRIHFVQRPVQLEEARTITFGLMASPAKPMPAGWRGIGRPDRRGIDFTMGHYFGMPATYASRYPMNKDFSSLDSFYQVRQMEKPDRNAVRARADRAAEDWVERNLSYEEATEELRAAFQNLVAIAIQRGLSRNAFTSYYDEFRGLTTFCPEHPIYRCAWDVRSIMQGEVQDFHKRWGMQITSPLHFKWAFGAGTMVPSYRDFSCYFGAKWLERSSGLYFDNAFAIPSRNPWMTSAFWREDGKVQPSTQIWDRREYLKRIWVLHQQLHLPKTPQIMMIHMTNAQVVPWESFNMCNLDLEWKFGAHPFQAKFTPELLRTESTGLQTGCIPMAISDVEKENVQASETAYALARRTRWGGFLVHEMRMEWSGQAFPKPLVDFGYGLENCEVFNYWAEDPPLKSDDTKCKWLLLKRNGTLLLLLCTWQKGESKVNFTFDFEALGLQPQAAIDVEHPQVDELDDAFEDALGDLDGGMEEDTGLAQDNAMRAAAEKQIQDPGAWQGPLKFDAEDGVLTVPLAPWGVRIIRLE